MNTLLKKTKFKQEKSPLPPFFKGGIEENIFLSPFEKGGQGGFFLNFKITSIIIIVLFSTLLIPEAQSQKIKSAVKLARVKYSGGGDWYNDPSGDVNLLKYVAKCTNINVDPVYEFVDLSSDNLFLYPLIFITGHGNMKFSETEIKKLRAYLQNGGFLYIDDDYGLDEFVKREMKRVFPEQNLIELPYNHGLYSAHFKFTSGVPKVHEHDNKPAKGYGLFHEGRLCVYYTYESNPSDGWADAEVHGDTPERRELSLKFGVNIVVWALTH
ncbi:MAG: hypothetical protein HW421_3090 [Ignavibacteria bacterium]|nr:hypothetical protein [Ignavibacteria bacterium]